jgi:hypothetical protein
VNEVNFVDDNDPNCKSKSLNLLEYDPFHHPENETSRTLPLVAYLPQRVLLLDAILDTEWNNGMHPTITGRAQMKRGPSVIQIN